MKHVQYIFVINPALVGPLCRHCRLSDEGAVLQDGRQ